MSASDDDRDAHRSGGQSLVFAVLFVIGLIVTGITAIAIFGSPSDGDPVVSFDLPPLVRGEPSAPQFGDGQTARFVAGNLVSDLALLEDTPDGLVPMIAADGRTPMRAYGRPFEGVPDSPRVTLVVTGLGVGANATALALTRLPPEVTIAFVPFVDGVQRLVDEARAAGRDVLLEVPMEPFDYPDSDPGPNALLVGADSTENMQRLNWLLARFTGYVGIANLLGGRFLGETGAIEPVLEVLSRRGLLFFDTGVYSNSVALTAARHTQTAAAAGALAIDAVQTAEAVDDQLRRLEAQAREVGFAIGTASPFPVSIERISAWAAGLDARGYRLAPLTAIVPDAE